MMLAALVQAHLDRVYVYVDVECHDKLIEIAVTNDAGDCKPAEQSTLHIQTVTTYNGSA